MLSAVITALLLIVMLLIVSSLIVSAWREHKRHKQKIVAAKAATPTHPLDQHVTAILHLQDGVIVGVEKPSQFTPFSLPTSWYTRRRTLVSLGFLLMLILTFFMQDGLAGEIIEYLTKGFGFSFLSYSQPTDVQVISQPLPTTASTRLIRIDSALPGQYYSQSQLNVWSYSSCSGIAMEMVMDAYGRHLIAADVLQEELNLGVWDAHLGLLSEDGIALTANYYGFNASLSHSRTLQDIINISNKGAPVIVGVRDSYNFPGGHIMVVRGGDSQTVYVADSSPGNFTHLSYSVFLGMWQGFSAVLTPR